MSNTVQVPLGVGYERWWLVNFGGSFAGAFLHADVPKDDAELKPKTEELANIPEKDLPSPFSNRELDCR